MLTTARAWLGSTHPGPSVAVTLVTVVLAIGAGLAPWQVLLLGLAMLLGQFSVGLSNDWLDAGRDRAAGRSDKPTASGAISVTAVRASAFTTAAIALALTVPLGLWALIAHTLFVVSAWLYNVGLKSTAVSVLPYIVSFGILPAIVTLALPSPAVAAWWALGAGALLGIAAHFANVLPDLEADRATGVRGLPHRLGARASGIVIALSLAAASALLWVGAPDLLHVAGLIVGVALATACVVLVLRGVASRLLFRLIIAAALLDVVLLAVSGSALVSR
jgi:4-hydroxybenzoate polyprenyltransferase